MSVKSIKYTLKMLLERIINSTKTRKRIIFLIKAGWHRKTKANNKADDVSSNKFPIEKSVCNLTTELWYSIRKLVNKNKDYVSQLKYV